MKTREIKFRGLRVDGKEWVYGKVFDYSSRNQIKTYIQGGKYAVKNGSLYGYEVKKETIGQYTGLKDKNGNEIYEGDIVDWYGDVGYLIFHETGWRVKIKKLDLPQQFYIDSLKRINVIGNIHQNPELLK